MPTHITLNTRECQHTNNTQQDNTTPPWMPPCICNTTKCRYLAKLCLDIIFIKLKVRLLNTPTHSSLHLISPYIIKLTLIHNKYTHQAKETKQNKYNSLINAIQSQGWQMNPLKVKTRGVIYTNSIDELKNLQIPTSSIEKTMKDIH